MDRALDFGSRGWGFESLRARAFTIGHSTHSAETLLQVLRAHEIQAVADIRRFPGSRRFPHFSGEAMREWLAEAGIEYRHFPGLGGYRRSAVRVNTGWRAEGFNAYADHLWSEEFLRDYRRLLEWIARKRVVVLCSEYAWWRCHRKILADQLLVSGIAVVHLLPGRPPTLHRLRPGVRIVEGHPIYRRTISASGSEPASLSQANDR